VKFFAKLFLCTAAILTVALSAMNCMTLSASLESAVEREITSGLSQHQLLEYALECSMLSVSKSGPISDEALTQLAEQSAQLLTDGGSFALTTQSGTLLAGSSALADGNAVLGEETMQYEIQTTAAGERLVVRSTFAQSGVTLQLTTAGDISYVFQDAQQLLRRGQLLFLGVLGGSFVAMLVMAWWLTRPIQQLKEASVAFSAGDYHSRANVTTRDELGELAKTYNQMADLIAQKMAALEEAARKQEDFVANFAHELKTPMTSIIGYADMIYQQRLTGEELHTAAEYIMNEGMRLESLSFKLLDLIALGRKAFLLEGAQLAPFFQDVEETIRPVALARGVTFVVDCQDDWVRVELDLCKTMVLNLLDNALKSGADQVRLTGRPQGTRYCVTVADNGRGIPPEELSRITEAFYMVDKSRSRREHGAGLGLALAARIAALHGTELTYQSTVGQGTQVSLTLQREDNDG
jgi:signal transduction histidine kinase